MFDMRAYIVSLAAVFLALTVGLILGTLVEERGVLEKQQKNLVDSIRVELEGLRQDNILLKDKSALQESSLKLINEHLVYGMLNNRNVLILTSDSNKGKPELVDAVAGAGAKTSLLEVNIGEIEKDSFNIAKTLTTAPVEKEAAKQKIIELMARSISVADADPGLQLFTSRGILDGSVPADATVNGVIIVLDGGDSSFWLSLAKELHTFGINVIAAEKSTNEASLEKFIEIGISTVDNYDQTVGQTAAILALKGFDGHYGIKKGVDGLLPKLSQVEKN